MLNLRKTKVERPRAWKWFVLHLQILNRPVSFLPGDLQLLRLVLLVRLDLLHFALEGELSFSSAAPEEETYD